MASVTVSAADVSMMTFNSKFGNGAAQAATIVTRFTKMTTKKGKNGQPDVTSIADAGPETLASHIEATDRPKFDSYGSKTAIVKFIKHDKDVLQALATYPITTYEMLGKFYMSSQTLADLAKKIPMKGSDGEKVAEITRQATAALQQKDAELQKKDADIAALMEQMMRMSNMLQSQALASTSTAAGNADDVEFD